MHSFFVMFFKEIAGQIRIKETLIRMVESDRVPNAILFYGPKGTGKLGLALAFSSYLLCNDRKQQESCGICASCKRTFKLEHPDVHFAFPVIKAENKKREDSSSGDFLKEWRSFVLNNHYSDGPKWLAHIQAENKQGDINVKECNDIIKKLSLVAFAGKQKVQIIWLSEYLGKNGNRLLKLLEEPPDNTTIVLISDHKEQHLNTILSRCQMLQVPPVGDEDIANYLTGHHLLSEDKASQTALNANGNMLTALEKLHSDDEFTSFELFRKWMRICYKVDSSELLKWSDEYARLPKDGQKHLLSYSLDFFQSVGRLSYLNDQFIRLSEQELKMAKKLVAFVGMDQITELSGLLSEWIYMLERNINAKILMSEATFKVYEIFKQNHKEKVLLG